MNSQRRYLLGTICALGLSFSVITPLQAQIQVKADGGVKIGEAPQTLTGQSWDIATKGLEANIGQVKMHTEGGGYLLLSGKTTLPQSMVSGVDGSGGSIVVPTRFTYLTGLSLHLGVTDNPVWEVRTNYLYTTTPVKTGSDRRMKTNIAPISEAKALIMQLNPVTYDLKPWEGYRGDSADLEDKAGFIAQEVQDVFPGAVGYDAGIDRYNLDYTYFIPYLTRTIQEQEAQIQEQDERIGTLEMRIAELEQALEALLPEESAPKAPSKSGAASRETAAEAGGAVLYQNNPNPFRENTTISYWLPENVRTAKILLHASSGSFVKEYALPPRSGQGQVVVEGHTLRPGMYAYSLVIDDRMVDTKRLVMTR